MTEFEHPKEDQDTPQRVLLIEDDGSQHKLIEEPIANAFPYVKTDYSKTGEEAWTKLMDTNYDFVILDWRLEGDIHGPAILNRLRRHEYYQHVPVLVLSGYLQPHDFALIEEFTFTGGIEKPFRSVFLIKKIKDLYKEAKWFRKKEKALINAFEQSHKSPDAYLGEMINICESSPRPFMLLLHSFMMLQEAGHTKDAEKVLAKAKALKPDSATLLSAEGKFHLRNGDTSKASECLKQALKMSPKNLDRLCMLGTISMKELETEKAVELFQQGTEIDKANLEAKDGLELSQNLDSYFKNSSPSSIPKTFAGLLNAVGISLVRGGDFEHGISHYESAMTYAEEKHDKARLAFNLGLGFLRQSDLEKASHWFKTSVEFDPNYEKAKAHLSKIKSKAESESGPAATHLDEDAGLELTESEAPLFDFDQSADDDGAA